MFLQEHSQEFADRVWGALRPNRSPAFEMFLQEHSGARGYREDHPELRKCSCRNSAANLPPSQALPAQLCLNVGYNSHFTAKTVQFWDIIGKSHEGFTPLVYSIGSPLGACLSANAKTRDVESGMESGTDHAKVGWVSETVAT